MVAVGVSVFWDVCLQLALLIIIKDEDDRAFPIPSAKAPQNSRSANVFEGSFYQRIACDVMILQIKFDFSQKIHENIIHAFGIDESPRIALFLVINRIKFFLAFMSDDVVLEVFDKILFGDSGFGFSFHKNSFQFDCKTIFSVWGKGYYVAFTI